VSEERHYFDPVPTTASDRSTVELTLPDLRLTLATDHGVFGRSRIDPGTKLLLLDGPEPRSGDRHLADLGAGYGPIALTLAARNPQATVWAIEVNERARGLCRDNADAAGLANIEVVGSEGVPDGVVLDRIWSNPPIRIGKRELQALLLQWLERLGPGGTAHLVVQKHLGSDSLQRWLTGQGWPTIRRASKAGYRLLDVGPRSSEDDGGGVGDGGRSR
jgi:16S rRNA (guanine1207-N2)-methyltransferase